MLHIADIGPPAADPPGAPGPPCPPLPPGMTPMGDRAPGGITGGGGGRRESGGRHTASSVELGRVGEVGPGRQSAGLLMVRELVVT